MQISTNTTGMQTGLSVVTDKEGRDYCVVVVKGTFTFDNNGRPILAEKQELLVYADVHYGDPAETSIKYECDFAPFKPRCDVLLNGSAYAPNGHSAERVTVGLQVGQMNKSFDVVGDRVWDKGLLSIVRTRPKPFTKMPIVYDRAFGGVDISEKDPEKCKTYVQNPVGIGYYPLTKRKALVGKPLPNTEETGRPIKTTSGQYRPMSFGPMSRNFPSRSKFAGTYDDNWKDERFPFLPQDFDEQYFLSAPADQQIPFLRGGEEVRATNLTPEGKLMFTIPQVNVPIVCKFRDREERPTANLDTMIVEPDQRRIILAWRARVPLGRKIHALREILVGPQPRFWPRSSKPHFESIQEFIEWKKQ